MLSPIDAAKFHVESAFPVETTPGEDTSKQKASGALRLGILLESAAVPAWIYRILESLRNTEGISIALVLLNRPKAKERHMVGQRAFDAYCRLDRLVFGRKVRSDAFGLMDAGDLLRGAASIESATMLQPLNEPGTGNGAEVDVLLDFGLADSESTQGVRATHGIMRFHPSDDDVYRGGPALFWEMYEGNPVSGATLRLLDAATPAGELLFRAYSRTHPYSLLMNRNEVYWKAAAIFTAQVKMLRDRSIGARTAVLHGPAGEPGVYTTPSVRQLFKFMTRALQQLLIRQFRTRLFHEGWRLAFADRVPGEDRLPGERERFRSIKPPTGHFYADPWAVSYKGKEYIFFEDYRFDAFRGQIGCLELNPVSGKVLASNTVIKEEFHMSYPCVFEADGNFFMIPETAESRSIRLYRAESFPWKWELDSVLMEDVNAVDSTLHWHEGRFWLFVNMSPPGSSSHDELHLFYADSVHGPWLPHRNNPVASDSRRARGAGPLFKVGKILYRPSQNCSIAYGRSIVINEVETLTVDEYREKVVSEISPEWIGDDSIRTHTLSMSNRLTVTDGFRYVPRLG